VTLTVSAVGVYGTILIVKVCVPSLSGATDAISGLPPPADW
jgi:hypothetical protein